MVSAHYSNPFQTLSEDSTTVRFVEETRKHRDEFYRFVSKTVGNSSIAATVFTSAVLEAYESLKTYPRDLNFRIYMYRIIVNKCFIAIKEAGDVSEPPNEAGAGAAPVLVEESPAHADPGPDLRGTVAARGDAVDSAFRRLPIDQRTCILLRAVQRFTYEEIAAIMNIPLDNVVACLAGGREKFSEGVSSHAQGNSSAVT